jgi:hypothetical protein
MIQGIDRRGEKVHDPTRAPDIGRLRRAACDLRGGRKSGRRDG